MTYNELKPALGIVFDIPYERPYNQGMHWFLGFMAKNGYRHMRELLGPADPLMDAETAIKKAKVPGMRHWAKFDENEFKRGWENARLLYREHLAKKR